MVTFSTGDSHNELNKKFLRNRRSTTKDKTVISREEYESYEDQDTYICDICGTALEYRKVDGEESFWCNTCISYVSPKSAKKTVQFEVPTDIHNIEPAITSIDEIEGDYGRVKIEHKIEPQGSLKAMQDKGIRITSYNETDGAGRPLKRKRDDNGEKDYY